MRTGLAWLTGFTGSAGHAAILEDKAVLIVDSRYTLQAKAEAGADYTVELFPKTKVSSWLAANAPKGAVIGYDPALFTVAGLKPLKQEAAKQGFKLRAVRRNPIDRIWKDRPAGVHAPIFIHEERFAGENAGAKLARVRKAVQEKGAAGLFVCAPDAVAWLFNIRGADVLHTPMPLARAYVPVTGKPILFTAPGHITPQNQEAIGELARIAGLADLPEVLRGLVEPGAKVMIDNARTTLAIAAALRACKAKAVEASDPCALFKAKKNATELEGARNAHLARRRGAVPVPGLARRGSAVRQDRRADRFGQAGGVPARDGRIPGCELRYDLGCWLERRHRALPRDA